MNNLQRALRRPPPPLPRWAWCRRRCWRTPSTRPSGTAATSSASSTGTTSDRTPPTPSPSTPSRVSCQSTDANVYHIHTWTQTIPIGIRNIPPGPGVKCNDCLDACLKVASQVCACEMRVCMFAPGDIIYSNPRAEGLILMHARVCRHVPRGNARLL